MALSVANNISNKFLSVLILLMLFSAFAHGITQNRKVFSGMEEMKKVISKMKKGDEIHGNELEWELRVAPLGPDPLHHNGHNPNKPRTIP